MADIHSLQSLEVLASGERVILQEIAGLEALKASLGESFEGSVETVLESKGRIIITGMGKSGHIARKIAATMASTGTPAYFVHPGEASHGDLGMITPDDVVIALSNSGETQELSDIIAYTRRFSIPLIGVVRRAESMLVEQADIAVVLPDVVEASPVNAPTTSTTMMLAWGDALAVAVLEARGFTKDDFGTYHPGGKLGKAFVKVSDVMHIAQELPLVTRNTSMQEVLLEMTSKRFGCAGVVDNEKLVGVITDGDLRRHMESELLSQTAEQVMTANPITVTPTQLAAQALAVMNDKVITALFAVEDGKPVGIIHIHDILRAGVA